MINGVEMKKELEVTLDSEIAKPNFDGLFEVHDTLVNGVKSKTFISKKKSIKIKKITTKFNSEKIKCLAKPDFVRVEISNSNQLYQYDKVYQLTDSLIEISIIESSLLSKSKQFLVRYQTVH
jgi:cell division protein FtsX